MKKRNNKLQKQKNKIKNGHRKLFDEMGKLLDSSYQLKLFQNSLIKEKENLLKYINDTKDYIENKSKIEILMKENKKLKNTINFYKKNINILKESFNKKIYEKFEKKSNLLKETLFKYEKLSKNYNELLEEKQNLIKENKNLLIFREKYNFLLKDKKNFEEFILNQMKKNEIVIKEKKNNNNSKTISFNGVLNNNSNNVNNNINFNKSDVYSVDSNTRIKNYFNNFSNSKSRNVSEKNNYIRLRSNSTNNFKKNKDKNKLKFDLNFINHKIRPKNLNINTCNNILINNNKIIFPRINSNNNINKIKIDNNNY